MPSLSELSQQINQYIQQCTGKIAIIIHQNPDGDAIGSALAVKNLLQAQEKQATVISPNAVASYLHWLPGITDVVNAEQEDNASILNSYALLICLDFNAPNRAGVLEEAINQFAHQIVVIDHHLEPKEFSSVMYSDPSAPATAQLVFRLAKEHRWFENAELQEVGICLYTGLMTDTGAFRFASVNKETHITAGELVSWEIDHQSIHDKIYDAFSVKKLRLFGYTLQNKLEVLQEYNTAYMGISWDEFQQFEIEKGDTEGLVNYTLSIKGIDMGAIFIEEEHMVKISFRSKGNVPVNEFSAKYFDGGGHKNAAGGRSYLSLDKTIKKFKSCLAEFRSEI